mgnify:CR=1 FL=1
MTLLTEPGSKTVLTGRLSPVLRTRPSSSAATLAMARTSPVLGRLMMAMPCLAPVAFTWSARASSVAYCSDWSSVR